MLAWALNASQYLSGRHKIAMYYEEYAMLEW